MAVISSKLYCENGCPMKAEVILSCEIPPDDMIDAVYALVFYQGKLVMTWQEGRDWTLSGGHRNEHEGLCDAVIREAYEEVGAVIHDPVPIAYIRTEILGSKPVGYRYCYPVNYQEIFAAVAKDLVSFHDPDGDSLERGLFDISRDNSNGWINEFYDLCVEGYRMVVDKPQKHGGQVLGN